jgi:Mn2+/Fe2+ NRAMP family transporter
MMLNTPQNLPKRSRISRAWPTPVTTPRRVLTPGAPLGLLTNAVQALAGVLLPSATVFLLLLCNDHAVLGPWVNGRALTVFTGAVIRCHAVSREIVLVLTL